MSNTIDCDKLHGDMSTRDLIARLQRLDPDGNRTVEIRLYWRTDTCEHEVRLPVSRMFVDSTSVVLK